MKFNLKLFVLVGVLAGFRDVCGMEEGNKDYDGFIVEGLVDKEEAKELNEAINAKSVIKAVYKTGDGGNVCIIFGAFQEKLSSILVCSGDNVQMVEGGNLQKQESNDKLIYEMDKNVEYTVYFIFNTVDFDSTSKMFTACGKLISADLRYFDTKNVKDMSYMFYNCGSLIEVDLSNCNTKNVTNMYAMFKDFSKLKQVFLPSKDAKIQKRCICCGDAYVLWNNREFESVSSNKVQFKKPKEIIEKISTVK